MLILRAASSSFHQQHNTAGYAKTLSINNACCLAASSFLIRSLIELPYQESLLTVPYTQHFCFFAYCCTSTRTVPYEYQCVVYEYRTVVRYRTGMSVGTYSTAGGAAPPWSTLDTPLVLGAPALVDTPLLVDPANQASAISASTSRGCRSRSNIFMIRATVGLT